MQKKMISTVVTVFCIFQLVVANSFNDSTAIPLAEVAVSANKLKLYSEMGRILTVIERSEIEKMAVKSIDDLLETLPGIDIRQRGVDGTQADVSMRGGTFDQVLVLLNGVNITDPQTGHYNLDIPIELSDVSRIEVLQGSAARLLGPNAFSGAINIVTENKERKSIGMALEAGSFGSYLGNVNASVGNAVLNTFASISHKASEGFAPNTDYKMSNVYSNSILNTSNAGKLALQLAYQQKEYGADGFYHTVFRNQFESTKTIFGALNWNLQHRDFLFQAQIYSRYHYDRFEFFRNFENAASWYNSHYYHLTNVTGGKTTATYLSSLGKFSVGADVRNEHIFSTTLGKTMNTPVQNNFEKNIQFLKEDNRLLTTAFADYSVTVQRYYLSAGIATTVNKDFGTYSYGGIDLGFNINPQTQIFMSGNTALRLPTFTDLYYSTGTHQGDVNLKPEHAKTLEAGAKYRYRGFSANISGFFRASENVIDWVKYDGQPKYVSTNITDVNSYGGEFLASYVFKNPYIQKLQVSYSYLKSDKEAAGFDSQYALDYLKHKATIDLRHKIAGPVFASWTYTYYDREGTFFNSDTNANQDYSPYHMLNVKLRCKLQKMEVFAAANNILNVRYLDFGGMWQPGINFRAGISYQL